jgi:predicted O-linked N-acetylglucosamine transferase (SPINDLY family)
MTPHDPAADRLLAAAATLLQAGDLTGAEQACRELLARHPGSAPAWNLAGLVLHAKGQKVQAVAALERAVALEPGRAELHAHLAELRRQAGQPGPGAEAARVAVRLAPELAAGHVNLALCLQDLEQHAEAEQSFRRALALQPGDARTHYHLGNLLRECKRLPESAASLEEALRLRPNDPDTLNSLGLTLTRLEQPDEADRAFREALRLRPGLVAAWSNLGHLLLTREEPGAALAAFERALVLRPDHVEALTGQGQALLALHRCDDGLAVLIRALRLQPGSAEITFEVSRAYWMLGRYVEALAGAERAATLKPDYAEAWARVVTLRAEMCDWRHAPGEARRLFELAAVRKAEGGTVPFGPWEALAWPLDRTAQRDHAYWFGQRYVEYAAKTKAERAGFPRRHAFGHRLRIGYLSHEFRTNSVAQLVAGLFGAHDRGAVEVFGYADTPSDDSERRRRLEAGCDHFTDLRPLSAVEAARRIAADGIDILVALNYCTYDSRPEILALRPAPVQVSYMLATTVRAELFDYFLTDSVASPPGQDNLFFEKLVRLPPTYLPADPQLPIAQQQTERSAWGLPERGFVFGCFNNPYKIDPAIFDVWMRVLDRIPGAVLWLYERSPGVMDNLRREAAARGIDPGQLVWARRVPSPEHLERHRHADLALDTALYSGHATTVYSLWAGVPVLTVAGDHFANRVSASVLTAAGLPELIAGSLEEYEQRAVALASNPEEVRHYRGRLAASRTTSPLWDPVRLARRLERAYQQMGEIHQAGKGPEAFEVTD